MKKNLRNVLAATLMGLSLGLASCGSISQDYADKINAAAATEKTSDDYTMSKIVKDLGSDYSGAVTAFGGILTWTKTKGNTTYTIVVTFNSDKLATAAVYGEVTNDSSK